MKAALYLTTAEVQYQGKTIRALIPSDRWSAARLAAVKLGRMILCWAHSARNGKQHRLLWALATMIADNTERFVDAEHVVRELKLNTGHVVRQQYNIPGLGIVYREDPASISYESMPQEEFEVWFEKVIAYVRSDLWEGIPSETIRQEIANMLGFDEGVKMIGHNSRRAA